jgi:hypothetical protein
MPAALEIKVPLNPPRSVLFFLGGRTGDPKQGGENCDADAASRTIMTTPSR